MLKSTFSNEVIQTLFLLPSFQTWTPDLIEFVNPDFFLRIPFVSWGINSSVMNGSASTLPENSHRWRAWFTSGLTQKNEKVDKVTNFLVSEVFYFGEQFQLDSKTIINSVSELKGNKLNTDINTDIS